MATGITTTGIKGITPSKMSARSVYKIFSPADSNMGIMPITKVIQGNYQNYVSPFFIFDEFGPMQLPKGAPFRVDAHPHAGIIPTTYLFKGSAHHRDSIGNDFEYHEGDFIQFTAGRGALHMEETGKELFESGGTFHGIQTWLNIPSHLKNAEPYVSQIKKENIPVAKSESAIIRVILGEVFGVKSQTELLMPVIYWHISLQEKATLELPVDSSHNIFIYMLNGVVETKNGELAKKGQAVLYERNGDCINIKATSASEILVLGGEVNNQPYVAQGTFVLNSQQEILQAYSDFEAGKFGDLAKTNGIRRQ